MFAIVMKLKSKLTGWIKMKGIIIFIKLTREINNRGTIYIVCLSLIEKKKLAKDVIAILTRAERVMKRRDISVRGEEPVRK